MPDLHAASEPSLELGKAQRKALASAGHLVERFASACDALRARVQDGRIALTQPWHDAVVATGSAALSGDGCFVLGFVAGEHGKLKMLSHLPSDETARQAVTAWQQENPTIPLEPLLMPPDSFNAPLWLALLRLRQLRDFWEPELRRSGLDQLLAHLPDAWLLDLTPLPPGAVLPRLEIASWEELDELTAAGRKFARHSVAGGKGSVLVEADAEDSASVIHAIYAKKESRVDMIGFIGKS